MSDCQSEMSWCLISGCQSEVFWLALWFLTVNQEPPNLWFTLRIFLIGFLIPDWCSEIRKWHQKILMGPKYTGLENEKLLEYRFQIWFVTCLGEFTRAILISKELDGIYCHIEDWSRDIKKRTSNLDRTRFWPPRSVFLVFLRLHTLWSRRC